MSSSFSIDKYIWFRVIKGASDFLEEILLQVEPNHIERSAIYRCLKETSLYRAYIAVRIDVIFEPVAIILASLLDETNALHIEDYALHPCIQGKGLARSLWDSWWKLIVEKERWVSYDQPMSIEVYPKNIVAWGKIMGVHLLSTIDADSLPWTNETITWMGKNIPIEDEVKIEAEWKAIQKKEMERQNSSNEKIGV